MQPRKRSSPRQGFSSKGAVGDSAVDTAAAMPIQPYANGEVNCDGATNATDAHFIAEYVAGKRGPLPHPSSSGETEEFLYYHSDPLGIGNVVTDEGMLQRRKSMGYSRSRNRLVCVGCVLAVTRPWRME